MSGHNPRRQPRAPDRRPQQEPPPPPIDRRPPAASSQPPRAPPAARPPPRQAAARPPPPRLDRPILAACGPPQTPAAAASASRTDPLLKAPANPQPVKKSAPALAAEMPERPGFGTLGTSCKVRANHFRIDSPATPVDMVFRYDVKIKIDGRTEGSLFNGAAPNPKLKRLYRAVITQLLTTDLGEVAAAFDGASLLFTGKPLRNVVYDVKISLEKEPTRTVTFKVQLEYVRTISLWGFSQEALQALDIVLREDSVRRYTASGQSFFSRKFGCQTMKLGMEGWKGFYQSVRRNQSGLCLNLDLAVTTFFQALSVLDYLDEALGGRFDRSRTQTPDEMNQINEALSGRKVTAIHTSGKYTVTRITDEALHDLTFKRKIDKDGPLKDTSVLDYFKEKYQKELLYPHLPALRVGSSDTRMVYLPMELCKIVEGQKCPKSLSKLQTEELRDLACMRARDRGVYIEKRVEEAHASKNANCARKFGVDLLNTKLMSVNARVLPAPKLKYGAQKEYESTSPGQWNMFEKKLYQGAEIKSWTFLNFSSLHFEVVRKFCLKLIQSCNFYGMKISEKPLLCQNVRKHSCTASFDKVESAIRCLDTEFKSPNPLELLIVILPTNNNIYGEVKRVCDTQVGLASQCCLQSKVTVQKAEYLANVALKINVKAGGRNMCLVQKQLPIVTEKVTIIFGADVTHPAPGDNSSPSVAAVVGSVDWPEMSKYFSITRTQPGRQEIIEQLELMTKSLLLRFTIFQADLKKAGADPRNIIPERIIFYRDGVSEGQFSQVLEAEVEAIRKACKSIIPGYKPTITFVVVQKRHHTRLFPTVLPTEYEHNNNVFPGTVVDTEICHPSQFDFFLCSHAAINRKTTSRPAHYHVLLDENGFEADELQKLTNDLCYTHARATKAVSYVPPAYYAHLAAFRARFYLAALTAANGPGVPTLPIPPKNIADSMYYC